jgi:phosphate-selective porin OprO/OprP
MSETGTGMGRSWTAAAGACALIMALVLPAPRAWAQTSAAGTAPAPAAEPAPAPAPPDAPKLRNVHFRWDDHPTLHLAKGTRIVFRARFQVDNRHSDAPIPDADDSSVDVARKRVGVEGEIAGLFDFQVERELTNDDPWRDVYVNYKQFEQAQFQAGKFKQPFSLDENTSPTNLDFVYRSMIATRLAPGRDIGWMAHGRVVNRIFRYEIGMFEHDGRNARPRNPERVSGEQTWAMRFGAQPFRTTKTILEDLLVGIAMTRSDLSDQTGLPEGIPGLRARTAFDQTFFNQDVWIRGRRERRGYEARWRPGPASIKAEYIRVTDERLDQSVEDTDLSPFLAKGWYVSGTFALTGEKKADGLDVPRRPLGRGGIGAVELALRLEEMTFGSEAANDVPSTSPRADVILGNTDRVTTFGVNWYLNRWVKIQFNVIRDKITDPSQGPLPSQPVIWNRVLRFQFQL